MGFNLNIIGVVFIALVILFAIIGCFYLITKENTTVFVANLTAKKTEKPLKTLLFVGDMMLGRGVEYQIKQHFGDYFYPFEKIYKFLQEFDIVFGNLEGPIVENPPNFADDSLRFAFSKDTAPALKKAGFDVLSLANNHTDNMFLNGLFQTRKFLTENNLGYVGEPWGCEQDFLLEQGGVLFLAFNETYPLNCPNDKIIDAVRTVRTENTDKVLIISMHWGEEYQTTNSPEQQEIAHLLIDAGADLIVGHHPHVVQGVESYPARTDGSNGVNKDKLIFYSLGNFVFDQDFSQETQEGLAVQLDQYPDKLVYRLFPIAIRNSQPVLMGKEELRNFLQGLSKISSENLSSQIASGKIEMILK